LSFIVALQAAATSIAHVKRGVAVEKPIRVLIVDDYRPLREWVRAKLGLSARFEIAGEAGDGHDAVAKAHEQNPDLVLLDIGLPGMNGIDVAMLLRRAIPRTRILFLSENSDPEVITTALSDGTSGFVLKSEADNDLLLAIETALRGEKFCSKEAAITPSQNY